MTKTINYRDSLKKQEDIIMRHFSTPIYTTHTRTSSIPVHKKKLILKKTLKHGK